MKKIKKCIVIACVLLGLISMTNLADASSSNISTSQAKISNNDENLLKLSGKYDSKSHSIKVKGVLSTGSYNWLRGIYLMDGQLKRLYYISQEDLIKQGNKFMYEYKLAKNSKPSSVFFSGNYDIIDGTDVPTGIKTALLKVPVDPFDINKLARERTIEDIRKTEKRLFSKGVPRKNYEVSPSITPPYKPGKLTKENLEYGLNSVKMFRYLANLPFNYLKLDPKLNEDAQYGTVILDRNKVLSHFPKKPAGMTDSFYERGYGSTSTSNLCMCSNDLKESTFYLVSDFGSNNIESLGHRQSILNLNMERIGIGQSGRFTAITKKSFPEDVRNLDIKWDYVSWPSEGYMPIEYFKKPFISEKTPWSISLNHDKYQVVDAKKVVVEIQKKNDSKKWRLTPSMNKYSKSGNYLRVSESNYYSDFIIFRPQLNKPLKNNDIFQVKITGLKNADGKSATLSYSVKFFNMKK